MKKLIEWFRPMAKYFLVIWVVLIVFFSSLPNTPKLKIDIPSFEIRIDYLLHFFEYFILAFLAMVTFNTVSGPGRPGRIAVIIIMLALFALADETHQLLIPGRSFNLTDLLSNFAGLAAGSFFTISISPQSSD